jgi:hypothetical protein
MSESHVLSALISKRSELLGLIDHHRKEIKKINDGLSHINASIKIFNPQYDLRNVKSKEFREKSQYFERGERAILVLETLRESKTPLNAKEVSLMIAKRKGIKEEDISRSIKDSLIRHYRKGVVIKAYNNGSIYWALNP